MEGFPTLLRLVNARLLSVLPVGTILMAPNDRYSSFVHYFVVGSFGERDKTGFMEAMTCRSMES